MNIVQLAKDYAADAHKTQQYGSKPYMYHLDKVAGVAQSFGANQLLIAACYLHDTIEDTGATKSGLSIIFGNKIATIVDLVSNQASKEATLKRIRSDKDAVFVKLCDRIANVSEGGKVDKYRKEYPLFKKILYKRGEFDGMWNKLDSLLQ